MNSMQEKLVEATKRSSLAFIANMSHDMRTPLAGMIGMINNLLALAGSARLTLDRGQGLSFSSQQQLLNKIEEDAGMLLNSTDCLLQLCNEVLDTMRLELDDSIEKSRAFDFYALVNNTMTLLKPVANNRGLTFSVNIADSVPQYLYGIDSYLSRVLINLASNALKFTDQGFVSINVLCDDDPELTPDNVMLTIVIADSGVGIPNDKFELIFENFSRLATTAGGIYKGSGLGLYAVKRYIKKMAGEIKLASEVGKGTQFTLMLPFKVTDHSDSPNELITPAKMQRTRQQQQVVPLDELENDTVFEHKKKPRILIAEDNMVAAMALKSSLLRFACIVDVAENAAESLDKLQSAQYDLMLMDVGLPDMNGIEAARKIRALAGQQCSSVPIIALTGHMDKREACLAAGMQDVLTKPAQPATLEELLHRYSLK